MKYHFRVHREGNKYWAQGIELNGCFTQADTREELDKNMQEALNLYIQEPANSKDLAPRPNYSVKRSAHVVEVEVDPYIAFAYLVRTYRIKHGLTQQEAAKKMGFDKVFSYQRLERKCNPNLKTLLLIKKVFPDFSIDYVLGRETK